MKRIFTVLILLILLGSCKSSQMSGQGIQGQVFWVAGNQMPQANDRGVNPEEKVPVQRTLRIHELTHINQARLGDALFGDIETPLIEEVKTDEEGRFSVKLPAGRYTVFTVEKSGYFANVFDLDSYINPYEVKEGEWTKAEILINYEGAY
ncbi:MAG TPA: carboxypeptidase-like regulatory domain-containing protein [Cyclobacteriaceae bacterium]|nr:carboxypeptidase-like regulatory domain-containing protein [Cyclobacteriaceae bacterium]